MSNDKSRAPAEYERSVSGQLATLSGALIVGGFFGVVAPATELSGVDLFWVAVTGILGIIALVSSAVQGLGAVGRDKIKPGKDNAFNAQAQLLLVGFSLLLISTCLLLLFSSNRNVGEQNKVLDSAKQLDSMGKEVSALSQAKTQLADEIEGLEAELETFRRQLDEMHGIINAATSKSAAKNEPIETRENDPPDCLLKGPYPPKGYPECQ